MVGAGRTPASRWHALTSLLLALGSLRICFLGMERVRVCFRQWLLFEQEMGEPVTPEGPSNREAHQSPFGAQSRAGLDKFSGGTRGYRACS